MGNKKKTFIYVTLLFGVFIIATIIIYTIFRINNMYNEYQKQMISFNEEYGEYDNYELVEDYEETSSSIGNTVDEMKNEENSVETSVENNTDEETQSTINEKTTNNEQKTEENIEIQDPTFSMPVEGEIAKGYSKDNLSYSETLKEWTTHNGIDIEANLTTIVKASADGTVKSIKNDPRYGLTIIITHVNGYETRYSNLLTTEFVQEGEKVTQGQTIGTIGNTASFEIVDNPHLHFEILKNNEYLDPAQYL
jgi:murein DD-endopeptidase MepM/ murein hydrolase activator NlpD